MVRSSRRVALVAAFASLALALAGCGDQEPAQRKAFIEFLQTRIVDKPGVHVPVLTADIQDKIGPYAKHYEVITTFQAEMDQSVKGFLQKAIQAGAVRSIADAISRHDDITAVRAQMADIRAALTQRLATAETARAALSQPDDLKPVYDAAFDRVVRIPAKGFQDELPRFEQALQSILALADYLTSHRDKVTVQGSNVTANDPKVRADVSALLAEVNKSSNELQEAQRRLSKIASGS